MAKRFKEYGGLNLPEINQRVLGQWSDEDVFRRTMSEREGCPSFVFFEGPPSANGRPGIHHVLARTIKDIFCRYKTMQGFQVKRKAGWDTHGLPVELGVEKELGITKEDIGKKISVDEYNAACRREVMKYTDQWEDLTKRMGYWVDMPNAYITYDNRYIETVWWLLSKLYEKGYLYKGYTIQPYSPAAGTGLSSTSPDVTVMLRTLPVWPSSRWLTTIHLHLLPTGIFFSSGVHLISWHGPPLHGLFRQIPPWL